MKNNYTVEDIERMSPVQIYEGILGGHITRFPPNYWTDSMSRTYAAIITRYLIDNVLQWSEEDILNKYSEKIFRQYKLTGMLQAVFSRSPYACLENAYPGKYKVWDLRTCTPKGYWREAKNRTEALTYLLEKTGKKVASELTNKDFLAYNLGGLMCWLSESGYDVSEVTSNSNCIQKNVSFYVSNNKSMRNLVRASIELPNSMCNSIGITKENSKVNVYTKDGKIIIEPRK